MFNSRELPWKVILVQLPVSMVIVSIINLVLFPDPFFGPIARATGGLIDGTLQANLLSILLFSLTCILLAILRRRERSFQQQAVIPYMGKCRASVVITMQVSGQAGINPTFWWGFSCYQVHTKLFIIVQSTGLC